MKKLIRRIKIALRILFLNDNEIEKQRDRLAGATILSGYEELFFLIERADGNVGDAYIGDIIRAGLIALGMPQEKAANGALTWNEYMRGIIDKLEAEGANHE